MFLRTGNVLPLQAAALAARKHTSVGQYTELKKNVIEMKQSKMGFPSP